MKKVIALFIICILAGCNQHTDAEAQKQQQNAELQAGAAASMQQFQKNAERVKNLPLK